MKLEFILLLTLFLGLFLISSTAFAAEYRMYSSGTETILNRTVQLKDVMKDGSVVLSIDSTDYIFQNEKTIDDMWIVVLDSHYSDYFDQRFVRLRIDSIKNPEVPDKIPTAQCGDSLQLDYGKSAIVGGKKITLEDVGNNTSGGGTAPIVVNVDGFSNSILTNGTFRGFGITVDSSIYDPTPGERSATFKVNCLGTFKDIVYECGKELTFVTRKTVQINGRNITLEDVGTKKKVFVNVDGVKELVVANGVVNGVGITVFDTTPSDQYNIRSAKMLIDCNSFQTTTTTFLNQTTTTLQTTTTTLVKDHLTGNEATVVALNKNIIDSSTKVTQTTFEGKDAYDIGGKKDTKLLGFIPTSMNIDVFVDFKTGEILKVNKPFWSFLAF